MLQGSIDYARVHPHTRTGRSGRKPEEREVRRFYRSAQPRSREARVMALQLHSSTEKKRVLNAHGQLCLCPFSLQDLFSVLTILATFEGSLQVRVRAVFHSLYLSHDLHEVFCVVHIPLTHSHPLSGPASRVPRGGQPRARVLHQVCDQESGQGGQVPGQRARVVHREEGCVVRRGRSISHLLFLLSLCLSL